MTKIEFKYLLVKPCQQKFRVYCLVCPLSYPAFSPLDISITSFRNLKNRVCVQFAIKYICM